MKKLSLSVVAFLALETYAMAGGNIAPVKLGVETLGTTASEEGFYIGGAYSSADLDQGSTTSISNRIHEEDYDAIMIQAGYQFNKYVAVEGRYWTSVGDGKWSERWDAYYYSGTGTTYPAGSNSGSGNLNMKAWGIYIKPMYSITNGVTIYGLLGYGNVSLSNAGDHWLDKNGLQWGIGTSYTLTEHLSVFADYVSLLKKDIYVPATATDYSSTRAYDLHTINLGITYKF